jgi:DNA-binding SARP family transcriptional activator/ABC-type glycerol-3-phosphate transport system substrate-binding protein
MDSCLQLRLLGPPTITLGGDTSLTASLPGKAQALLFYLAVTGQPQPRPALAGLLWGDLPEATARANLRRALVDLRQTVGDYLEIERQTVGFGAAANIWIDVVELAAGVDQPSSPGRVERLQKAVELYRGDFLAGFYIRAAPDFESWVAAERERLRGLVVQALCTLADYHSNHGELARGIAAIRRVLVLEPWREEAHRQLMLMLAHNGQRGAALAQFETCRQILDEELEVEPGPEMVALYEGIREGRIGRGAGEPRGRSELSPAPPHNLPPQPSPLIGREKELAEVNNLLADPDCRLLTLFGPGGIGKTRLAIEVARQALDKFPEGVYFVSLASTDSAEDIIPRIATTFDPEQYPMGQAAADFLPELHRRDPVRLLVLDNLEQLLPDGCVTIEALLTQTQRLKLIVTSRQAVNIRWEWRCDLDGLAYPAGDTADNLESYGAVAMFLQRMRQTRRVHLPESEIQATAKICRLVGGMALGIELAAAQAGRLSCAAIAGALERNLDALVVSLRDLPARQHSLRASFEVTWANLSPQEQALFRRLSLFRSSFTAEAAQAVAEAGLLQLINLIDKSLLRQASPERYDIHEVLRHFAKEKLAEVPAEQAQALKHYRHFYTTFLQERTEALQQGIELTDNVAAIYTEIDNLWAGWVRMTGQDEAEEFASALVRALHAASHAQFVLSPDEALLLEHHKQLLESRSSAADVGLIDLIWADTLADHLLDLGQDLGDEIQNHFVVYVENNIVAGRLVALPYWADLGLLYYRADLLTKYGFAGPPATWDELELMAAEIQAGERAEGRADFWGFIWQGAKSEILTCNALEWQVSHGGGRLIEPEGLITVNNPQTITALERAARWVGTISPETVTEAGLGDEVASYSAWAAGNVAFMRNWVFFERIDNPKTKSWIGVTLLPSGGAGPAATLGGRQIAISKYARHPQAAIELVRHATGRKAQLQRAVSPPCWPPTIPDLYDHPETVAIYPHLPKIKEIFSSENIVVRPSKVCGPLYPQVSKAYSTAVHAILTGQVETGPALSNLEAELVEITGFRVGQP